MLCLLDQFKADAVTLSARRYSIFCGECNLLYNPATFAFQALINARDACFLAGMNDFSHDAPFFLRYNGGTPSGNPEGASGIID